jgi:hypothetical protein
LGVIIKWFPCMVPISVSLHQAIQSVTRMKLIPKSE